jgi:hypothetical protein
MSPSAAAAAPSSAMRGTWIERITKRRLKPGNPDQNRARRAVRMTTRNLMHCHRNSCHRNSNYGDVAQIRSLDGCTTADPRPQRRSTLTKTGLRSRSRAWATSSTW